MAVMCARLWGQILLLLVLALSVPGAGAAEKSQQQKSPEVPDPSSLAADWWRYFEAAGDEAEERLQTFQTQLDAISESLTQVGTREDRLRAHIVELADVIESYSDALSRESPPPSPALPTAKRYTIDELLKLVSVAREKNLELELEHEDVERSTRLMAVSAKRIDDAKASYLALPETAPARLERGLTLMRMRFVQGLNEIDLKLRRSTLERLTKQAKRLEAELERAGTSLSVTPEDAITWEQRAIRAREEQLRLEAEASSARLRLGQFGENARERSERRRLEQKLLALEARIVEAHLSALQSDLTVALVRMLSSPTPALLEKLRERKDALDDQLQNLSDSLNVWRRATERERAAALAQLAETASSAPDLAELHRSRVSRTEETSEQISKLARLRAQGQTLSDVAGRLVAKESGTAADLAHAAKEFAAKSWSELVGWMSGSLFTINETPVTAAGLLRVAVILLIAWWLSRLVQGGLTKLVDRREAMSRAALYTLGRLSHYAILVIAFIVALSSIGIDFTKFALFVSALGVGLGFALQAIFSNLVAGLIILFERSLKVGDFVELESGLAGEVREVNIRATLITTNDNIDILVPNSEFVSGRVTNWTLREAHRRVKIPFGVAYGTEKEKVESVVIDAARAVPFTLSDVEGRGPQVWLVDFGESSLDFELVVWLTQDAVKRPGRVQAAYCWAIETALRDNGIEIPFPQRDLHIRSISGGDLASGLQATASAARD